MNEKKVDFVMYLESLRNLSIEIDAIALELASCGPDRYWRCELLDQIHIDHPLFFKDLSKKGIPRHREKRIPEGCDDILNIGDEGLRQLSDEAAEKERVITTIREKLLPMQEKGMRHCEEMFRLVLEGKYEPAKLKPYSWLITFPAYARLELECKIKRKEVNSMSLFVNLCSNEKKRAAVLAMFNLVCEKLGIQDLFLNERHIQFIEKAMRAHEDIDNLLDSILPGLSKRIKFIKIDPYDPDIGTRKDLEKCGNFKNAFYYKLCVKCGDCILRHNFSDSGRMKRGSENMMCDKCKPEQRKRMTKKRVRRFRQKKAL